MPARTFFLILMLAILAGGASVAAVAFGAPQVLPVLGIAAVIAALLLRRLG